MRLSLGELIRVVYKNNGTSTGTLTAANTTTYDLANSDNWFRDTCTQEASRRWLEAAIDQNKNVYLVVGFRTAQDASLTSSVSTTKDSGVRGSLPVGSIVPLNNVSLNPIAHGTQDGARATNLSFDTPGEQVFAVLYRKVKFSWLSSRKTENMKLEEGNRWKSVWEWRGPSIDAQDEEDDVLNADLTDSSDLDDGDDDFDDDDDADEEADMEDRDSQSNVITENTSGGQQTFCTGDAQLGIARSNEACKTTEVPKPKQSVLKSPGLWIMSGVMCVLLLLLCQFFLPMWRSSW